MSPSCWDKPRWTPASTTARTLLFWVKNVCCCVVKPLQLVFKQTKQACTTPVLITLHLLPVAACINFKSLVPTYRVLAESAPSFLNNCVPAHLPLVHSVPHISIIGHSCLYRHGNPDIFFQSCFPTVERPLEHRQSRDNPLFRQKAPLRHSSSECTCSPNSTYLSAPISSHLHSPSFLFISLFTPSP